MILIRSLFLIIFLTSFIFASNNDLKKISLQLNWKYQFEFAGFIVAKEKGFYKEQGLDLEIREYNHNINVLNEIKEQKATFGLYDLSVAYFDDNKNPIKLIANYFKRSSLVFIANQDILSPKELKNKTIMAEKSQLKTSTLASLLNKFNIKEEDYKTIAHNYSSKDFIEGKVDVMSAYLSNELYEIRNSKKPYTIIDPINFGINGSGVNVFTSEKNTLNNPLLIKKFIEATNKGWEYSLENKEEIVDLIYNKYSKRKTKKALLFESEQIDKLVMADIYNIGSINKELLQREINEYSRNGLIDKKFHIENFIFDYENDINEIIFSKEEKNYILNKNEIKMCIDPNWMPYEKIEDSKHLGITSEYISIFEEKLGIPIKLIETKDWAQSLEYAKSRKCDILSLAMPTPKRNKYMNFTAPYITFPLVIATKTDKLFVTDPEKIITKEKIGLVKGYAMTEILRNKYKNNKIIEVQNVDVGLKMVEEEKLYGFIDALPTIAYILQREYLKELKIAGKFNENLELSVAIRNDDLIMYKLFQKVVKFVEEGKRQEILNKYISVEMEGKFDYKLFYQILFVIALFVFFGIYRERQLVKHNKVLKKQRGELELVKKKLEESLENIKIVLDSTIEAVLVFENLICIDANENALSMFGYKDKDQMIGLHISKFTTKNSLNVISEKIRTNNSAAYELKGKKRDGDIFPILVKGTNVILDSKKVRISAILDISEIKDKDRIFFQQSKMASMGEMLENIAHQWRQPLSLISTTSTSLELKTQLGISSKEETIANLKKINKATQYLSQTIDDFRNFFKKDKEKTSFSVMKNIKRDLDLLNGTFKSKNIDVIFESIEDLKIKSYENEFTQALLNIFSNAVDAFEHKKEDNCIFISSEKTEDSFIIKIKDNAGGIDKEIIENVFEPYFTTKHKSQGTGIGLYMTHQIIEKNIGGRISVRNSDFIYKNEKYRGAQFTILLPLS